MEGLKAESGYEPALSAALGARLTAAVVEDLAAGEQLLDAGGRRRRHRAHRLARTRAPGGAGARGGATRLLGARHARARRRAAGRALLGDVWVVESLRSVSGSFRGVAVTRAGRLLDASTGELSQAPAGGGEQLLEEVARREALVSASEQAAADEKRARADIETAAAAVAGADAGREEAEVALRQAAREHAEAGDEAERARWLLERRRESADEGPESARRAGLSADLRGEQRLAERAARERAERAGALDALQRRRPDRHRAERRGRARGSGAGRRACGRRGPS